MRIVETDAVLTLHATVRDTWALRTWILGHAENLTVVKPSSLRKDLAWWWGGKPAKAMTEAIWLSCRCVACFF